MKKEIIAQEDKTKVFLDTNILLDFWNKRETNSALRTLIRTELFHFYISNIVLQEFSFFLYNNKTKDEKLAQKIKKLLKVMDIDVIKTSDKFISSKNFQKILTIISANLSAPVLPRKNFIHTNDLINVVIASDYKCDYFMTIDNDLLNYKQIDNLKFVKPVQLIEEGAKK